MWGAGGSGADQRRGSPAGAEAGWESANQRLFREFLIGSIYSLSFVVSQRLELCAEMRHLVWMIIRLECLCGKLRVLSGKAA